MKRSALVIALLAAACGGEEPEPEVVARNAEDTTPAAAGFVASDTTSHADVAAAPARGGAARTDDGPRTDLAPNELGRIPVVEYHLIGAEEGRWTRTPENFRKDLELLYSRG